MKKIKLIILIFTVALLFTCGCTKKLHLKDAKKNEFSFEMFGKTPARNFFINEKIDTSIQVKWKTKINGSFNSTSITAHGNYIFVPDLSGRIYAINLENGNKAGVIKEKGSIANAILINGLEIIYILKKVNSQNTFLKKFNYSTGKEISEKKIEESVSTEPVKLIDGILIFTDNGNIIKYDFGLNEIWKTDIEEKIYSVSSLIDSKIIVGNSKGEILLIDEKSGKIILKKDAGILVQGGFTNDRTNIFTATTEGKVIALNKNDLTLKWEYSSGDKINLIPVIDDKFLYISNLRGNIYKLNKHTGEKIWQTSSNGIMNTTPLLFNNYLVQPDLNKRIIFVNVENGSIDKEIQFDKRVKLSPVFYKNILIIGTDDGQIYAYE